MSERSSFSILADLGVKLALPKIKESLRFSLHFNEGFSYLLTKEYANTIIMLT